MRRHATRLFARVTMPASMERVILTIGLAVLSVGDEFGSFSSSFRQRKVWESHAGGGSVTARPLLHAAQSYRSGAARRFHRALRPQEIGAKLETEAELFALSIESSRVKEHPMMRNRRHTLLWMKDLIEHLSRCHDQLEWAKRWSHPGVLGRCDAWRSERVPEAVRAAPRRPSAQHEPVAPRWLRPERSGGRGRLRVASSARFGYGS